MEELRSRLMHARIQPQHLKGKVAVGRWIAGLWWYQGVCVASGSQLACQLLGRLDRWPASIEGKTSLCYSGRQRPKGNGVHGLMYVVSIAQQDELQAIPV